MAHGKSPKHKRRPAARKKEAAVPRAPSRGAQQEGSVPAQPASAGPGHDSVAKPAGVETSVRLQKLLAGAGFGSRRVVEQYLIDERVTVNGRTAALGDRAIPGVDDIRLDGERLVNDRPVYWVLNKPRGVVTTVRDEEGRRTVIDLLPRNVGRVFPVGRLDKETSGLLLLTNDGEVAYTLLHPSLGNEREYRVVVKGQVDAKAIAQLERGVPLEEGRTSPAAVSDVRFDSDAGTSSLSLTLGEGRKRQIRRSLLVLGHPVKRLARVRMGPLRIGRLAVGEARPLRPEERRALLAHVAWLKGEGDRPPESAPRASLRTGAGGTRRPATVSKSDRRGPSRNTPARKSGARKSGSRKKAAGRKTRAKKAARKKTSGKRVARKQTARKKSAGRKAQPGPQSARQRPTSSRKGPRR